MDITVLLQWHYLIFLLPFGVAALMLLYSAMTLDGGDGDGEADADGDADADADADADGDAEGEGDDSEAKTHSPSVTGSQPSKGGLLRLLGVGRIPLTMVLETFGLGWGFCGFWANQLLVKSPHPGLGEMLPSLVIACVGAVVGARFSAEMISRLLPSEETTIVSRKALFGLTGRTLFPISEETGRVRIYDEHGTMHDEPCRVATGHLPIEKGQQVLVVDIDRQGRLLVEEVPASVR